MRSPATATASATSSPPCATAGCSRSPSTCGCPQGTLARRGEPPYTFGTNKRRSPMTRIGILVPIVVLAAVPGPSPAQSYPSKPVRLINAFAPGGASDVVARNFANKLTDYLGRQVTVENRVGAGGNVAAEYVARSPADGYTILMGTLFLATNQSQIGRAHV